jgi:quinol-cytochrome oxidoreductase complex cytochrome b subunit
MNWTLKIRELILRTLPIEHLLPDKQPEWVSSWVYYLGALAIASLVWVIGSGVVLAFMGPNWWHVSPQGHFMNSIHFWSVQAFFFFMVLHLWGQYWMGSWRDGRVINWISGVSIFLVAIITAFTGYLSQTNLDSEWIAVNAKDAFNAVGFGAFFNPMNFGQMYGLHVMLFPVAVVLLVTAHILAVRVKGVVKPYYTVSDDESETEDDKGK